MGGGREGTTWLARTHLTHCVFCDTDLWRLSMFWFVSKKLAGLNSRSRSVLTQRIARFDFWDFSRLIVIFCLSCLWNIQTQIDSPHAASQFSISPFKHRRTAHATSTKLSESWYEGETVWGLSRATKTITKWKGMDLNGRNTAAWRPIQTSLVVQDSDQIRSDIRLPHHLNLWKQNCFFLVHSFVKDIKVTTLLCHSGAKFLEWNISSEEKDIYDPVSCKKSKKKWLNSFDSRWQNKQKGFIFVSVWQSRFEACSWQAQAQLFFAAVCLSIPCSWTELSHEILCITFASVPTNM